MSLHRNPAAQKASKRISREIEAFLAAGNSIYQCTEEDNEYARYQRKRKKPIKKVKPNPFRTLSVQQVLEIRSIDWNALSVPDYNDQIRDFVKRFRSSDETIRKIIRGQTYKEIV